MIVWVWSFDVHTSFSGRVWFCLSKKSKSWPSMNSSTVQKLGERADNMKERRGESEIVRTREREREREGGLTSWNQFQRRQTTVRHAAGNGGTSHMTKYQSLTSKSKITSLQCDPVSCECYTPSEHAWATTNTNTNVNTSKTHICLLQTAKQLHKTLILLYTSAC